MAEIQRKTLKVKFCDHVNCEVNFEVETVLPAEFLPDQPGRIVSRRCSLGTQCSYLDKVACVWAGTNPNYDPFAQ